MYLLDKRTPSLCWICSFANEEIDSSCMHCIHNFTKVFFLNEKINWFILNKKKKIFLPKTFSVFLIAFEQTQTKLKNQKFFVVLLKMKRNRVFIWQEFVPTDCKLLFSFFHSGFWANRMSWDSYSWLCHSVRNRSSKSHIRLFFCSILAKWLQNLISSVCKEFK